MPNIKRFADLTDYTAVLPYASEMFGVYQPLIGWRSKRHVQRAKLGLRNEAYALITQLAKNLANPASVTFNEDCTVIAPDLRPAEYAGPRLIEHDSMLLREVAALLRDSGGTAPRKAADWRALVKRDVLSKILQEKVLPHYNSRSIANCRTIAGTRGTHGSEMDFALRRALQRADSQRGIKELIDTESRFAGVVALLVENDRADELNRIFFDHMTINYKEAFFQTLEQLKNDFEDPYLTFDPKKDVGDVTLSPLGIVHLYRPFSDGSRQDFASSCQVCVPGAPT